MKIHVIVNPKAGRQIVQKNLEQIIGHLMITDPLMEIKVTCTQKSNDAAEAASLCTRDNTDLILGCGGDGTINEIVNGLMRSGQGIPLAILAAGTSNDFATSLHLPETPEEFCKVLQAGYYKPIDLGIANEKDYFINVASFGMFTDVAHATDRNAKNNLGLLAYYLKAASSAPEQLKKYAHLDIHSNGEKFSGDYAICIVSNSMSIGSFRKLMYKADVSDGLFDVLMLKRPALIPKKKDDKPGEFNKLSLFHYFQTPAIKFEVTEEKSIDVDLDGEAYGRLPLSIRVCHNAIRLLVPPPQD